MKDLLPLLLPLLSLTALAQPQTTIQTPTPADRTHNFKTAMRAFYLWRCGMAVSADYDGEHYHTEACHLDDGYTDYIETPSRNLDGTGGWHDAGDYGKYTVNAGVTMATLFYTWDHYLPVLKNMKLDIPNTAPRLKPDFLKELAWEVSFLLKMQYPDGSGRVSHKLTRKEFSAFIMPQDDHEPRYFTEWSSAATADFVAVMAMASRHFRPYDKKYAQQCLDAAWVSYNFLVEHPESKGFVQGDFSTGGYMTGDRDDRLWADAEMWEATGDTAILHRLEDKFRDVINPKPQPQTGMFWGGFRAPATLVANNWDWGEVSNLAAWTYAQSKRPGRDQSIVDKVNEAILADAKSIHDRVMAHEYGCPLTNYFWGCNGLAARSAVNLHMAEIISHGTIDYTASRERIAAYLLGINNYHRSFVTGLGINPPMHPHDRRSAADGIEKPWPGYLVGGGHTATDWVDDEEDYARNEIAINWQAGLVYLFATLLQQK